MTQAWRKSLCLFPSLFIHHTHLFTSNLSPSSPQNPLLGDHNLLQTTGLNPLQKWWLPPKKKNKAAPTPCHVRGTSRAWIESFPFTTIYNSKKSDNSKITIQNWKLVHVTSKIAYHELLKSYINKFDTMKRAKKLLHKDTTYGHQLPQIFI
jgi:hypothetical protein